MKLRIDASEAERLAHCIGREIVHILIPSGELDPGGRAVEVSAAIVRFDDGTALTLGSERVSEFKKGEVDVLRLYAESGEQAPPRWPGGPRQEFEVASPLERCFGREILDVKLASSAQSGGAAKNEASDLLEVDGGLFLIFGIDGALEFDVVSAMPEAISLTLRDAEYLAARRDLVPLAARRMRLLDTSLRE